jgi:ATP-dependent DNA ligase
MALPLRAPFSPMEALSVDRIPVGRQWQYEPKWDGFRCIVFRDGKKGELQSKSGRMMTRYFEAAAAGLPSGIRRQRAGSLPHDTAVPSVVSALAKADGVLQLQWKP